MTAFWDRIAWPVVPLGVGRRPSSGELRCHKADARGAMPLSRRSPVPAAGQILPVATDLYPAAWLAWLPTAVGSRGMTRHSELARQGSWLGSGTRISLSIRIDASVNQGAFTERNLGSQGRLPQRRSGASRARKQAPAETEHQNATTASRPTRRRVTGAITFRAGARVVEVEIVTADCPRACRSLRPGRRPQ
jgi:hypothetical protein